MEKSEIQEAILFFADKYSKKSMFEQLLIESSLPEVVSLIIEQMFLNKFNYYFCSDEEYRYYKIIYEYA